MITNRSLIISEILQIYLETKTLKRTCIMDIMESREQCKFNLFGKKCDCGVCKARDLYESLNQTFLRRQKLGEEGQHGFFQSLVKLLTMEGVEGISLLGFENFSQIVLYVLLEQLRGALAGHIRGCRLSYCPKLEMILTMLRRNLNTISAKEACRFMDTRNIQVSVFNDDFDDQRDFKRRHLIHCRLDFTAGFHLGQTNLGWIRKGWSDSDICDLLAKAESVKRKLRHSVFNEESDLTFALPDFDQPQKVYKSRALNIDECDIAKPLVPKKATNKTFIL